MSDIFREVDEALQKDKAAKFWKENGNLLIGCAIALVLGTAANTGYHAYKSAQNQKETAKIVMAADDKDMALAMEKAATTTKGTHKIIAQMNAAPLFAKEKNFTKAAALYESVLKDSAAPSDLKDLATILYTRSFLLTDEGKKADPKTLTAPLEKIAANKNAAFQFQAKLDAALLYGSNLKDYAKALSLLDGFEKESQSDSLLEKATALKHVYQYEQSKSKKTSP